MRMADSTLTASPPGPFNLPMAEGFVTQTIANTLRPGEDYIVPAITMSLATVITEVRVSPSKWLLLPGPALCYLERAISHWFV